MTSAPRIPCGLRAVCGLRSFRSLIISALIVAIFGQAASLHAQSDKAGANGAAADVARLLSSFVLSATGTTRLDDRRTEAMLELASRLRINIYELLDASYRYLAPRDMRIAIMGDSLRKAEARFDFGRERVRSLLPVDVLDKVELGAVRSPDERAMDVYLSQSREEFIEIGTAVYDTRFGFGELSPLRFAASYGVKVKRFPFSSVLERLELYEPGKGAIYVKGLPKPKKWNLWIVTVRKK
jgi:hypothetical protein